MHAERSPFPLGWPGIGLDCAGLDELRPDRGTYGLYSFHDLPPLPLPLAGDLSWLADAPAAREWAIGGEPDAPTAAALARLRLTEGNLPETFLRFLAAPLLQRKIRSATACTIDLCAEAVPSPIGGGRLVRFLADQQGCLFWYLYLEPGGAEHAVVASPGWYGTPDEADTDWPQPDPGDIVFCAETFETFLCRFWLENEIFFACGSDADDDAATPLPAAAALYLERYRSRPHAG